MFDREQENLRYPAALAKLGAVSVLFPAHITHKRAVGGPEGNEVATTPMVRPQHQAPGLKFRKGALDIARAKTRAVPADRNDFVVSKLIDFLDGIFQAGPEVMSYLSMNVRSAPDETATGGKEMNIDFGRKTGAKVGRIQKRASGLWKSAARQVRLQFIRENKNGSPGHVFGYVIGRGTGKYFHWRVVKDGYALPRALGCIVGKNRRFATRSIRFRRRVRSKIDRVIRARRIRAPRRSRSIASAAFREERRC